MSSDRLRGIGERIELLSISPEKIRAPLVRLVRPVLARMGWQPKVSVKATAALCEALRAMRATDDHGFSTKDLAALMKHAIGELEDNVSSVERAAVVNREPPIAHAQWLRRLYE